MISLNLPGLKPCATISVMPMAFAEINSVGMTDFVIWNLFRGIKYVGIYSMVFYKIQFIQWH